MDYDIDMITVGNRYVYQIREEDIIQEFDTYKEAEEYLSYLKELDTKGYATIYKGQAQ